jgi:hypothetical protein
MKTVSETAISNLQLREGSVVVTIGVLQAGTEGNVIPDEAIAAGNQFWTVGIQGVAQCEGGKMSNIRLRGYVTAQASMARIEKDSPDKMQTSDQEYEEVHKTLNAVILDFKNRTMGSELD